MAVTKFSNNIYAFIWKYLKQKEMVKKVYKALRSRMSLMAQKKSEAKAKAMIHEMALNDLRQARSLS